VVGVDEEEEEEEEVGEGDISEMVIAMGMLFCVLFLS
jgi:hypothetical protein